MGSQSVGKKGRVALTLALVCIGLGALFSITALLKPPFGSIKASLHRQFPDMPIDNIVKTPLSDLYEVDSGDTIAYTNSKGSYILVGQLVDAKTRKNLTMERMGELSKVDFSTLPIQDAIKVVRGNGRKKIAVFSDPNCPHCRHFEATLQGLENVTVYTFLFPILGPDSKDMAKAIWCSSDHAAAWENWMLDHRTPAATDCDVDVLDRNIALATKLHIRGTPTAVLESGRRIVGEVPLDELNNEMGVTK
ncbi:MAG: DsbC family protein [Pseudomonadota bacterium]